MQKPWVLYLLSMGKSHVLILFGGQSSEHDVSIASAKNIVKAIDGDTYDIDLVAISEQGEWRYVDTVREPNQSDSHVMAQMSQSCFIVQGNNYTIHPTVVFPILHGTHGEDGTIQGLCELMNIPHVGCGVEASALCMDKVRTKQLLASKGIQVVPSISFSKADDYSETLQHTNYSKISEEIDTGPWFVKPSRSGSSVGVSKVTSFEGLSEACQEAFQHDEDVLIEQAIVGHEIEVAVLGNGKDLVVSDPGEIIPGEEFYSYTDKYSEESTSHASFELPESIVMLKEVIRDQARIVYTTLGCHGLSRIDFFVTDDGEVYLNEVNTMPGFTHTSMYPKLMERAGYPIDRLVGALLELAVR